MRSFTLLVFCGLFPAFAVPSPLNIQQGSNDLVLVTGPQNSTVNNLLLPSLNASTILTDAKIDCDQIRFGNPPVASAQDAVDQIPHDVRTYILNLRRSYGPRGGTFDVGLPKRWISCKLLTRLFLIRAMRMIPAKNCDSGWRVHHRPHADILSFSYQGL